MLIEMDFKSKQIILNAGILDHIKASEGWDRLHAEELQVQMHRPEQVIQPLSFKKGLIGAVEGSLL